MDPITLDAVTSAVTIYPAHAKVTRRAYLDLKPGQHETVLTNLPPGLLPGSLTVSAKSAKSTKKKGGAEVIIVRVSVESEGKERNPEEFEVELARAAEKIEETTKRLAEKQKTLQEKKQFFLELARGSSQSLAESVSSGKLALNDCDALEQYLFDAIEGTDNELITVEQKLEKLERDRSNLGSKLDEKLERSRRQPYRVATAIELEEPAEFYLEFGYLLEGAGWYPYYDARVFPDDEKVLFTTKAAVYQATNEEWRDVALTLSTGRPSPGGSEIKLEAWELSLPPKGEEKKMPDLDAVLGQPAATSAAFTGGLPMTFAISLPETILPDGSIHRVTIGQDEFPVVIDHVLVPRQSEYAFRRVTVQNSTDRNLLPGAINVFHEHDFVGTSRIDAVAPKNKFEFYMGTDDRIVGLRSIDIKGVTRRLASSAQRNTVEAKIRVTNTTESDLPILIIEQHPVSKSKDLAVKFAEAKPKVSRQSKRGFLNWNLEVKGGDSKELKYSYQIEYPKGRMPIEPGSL
ncbi:MAG: DUF4139 domain-containing protein [Planctomycetota bacterium]|jgi:hypothetical protein